MSREPSSFITQSFAPHFIALWLSIIGPGAVLSASQLLRDGTLRGLEWVPLLMALGLYVLFVRGA